jgi:hypothetical protein
MSDGFSGRLIRKPAFLGWAWVGREWQLIGVGETAAQVRNDYGPGLTVLRYGERPPTLPPKETPDLLREEREALGPVSPLRTRQRRRQTG